MAGYIYREISGAQYLLIDRNGRHGDVVPLHEIAVAYEYRVIAYPAGQTHFILIFYAADLRHFGHAVITEH